MYQVPNIDYYKYMRLSPVEKKRYDKFRQRYMMQDERDEPRHPNRQSNSRRAMRNMVRFRNKKEFGNYAGVERSTT